MNLLRICAGALLLFAPAAFGGVIVYTADLSGPNESPVNASPGTGFALVTIDDIANTLEVNVTFSGLTGTTTNSHIHCCTATPGSSTAGVATVSPTFTGFPSGVTSGSYDHTFDLTLTTSYNGPYVTANGGTAASAEAALLSGIASGKAYLNIHTSTFGGGEIRGFLIAQTPEPGTFALGGAMLAGLIASRLRRKN